MRWFKNILLALFSLGFLGLIVGIGIIAFALNYYGKDLPDYNQLKEYEPSIVTRIYAGDGNLLAEYAEERRIFVPIQKIPNIVKQAFMSAEDKNFYKHNGIDYTAVARAIIINVRNLGSGRRLVGASTITQQVAKNFLLTNEVSYERKIKEAILAMRMEKALSKDQLLELYLNEIFLGQRAYGVAAAAARYFNKQLTELSIEEAAYLAALPKAPNNYHPIRKRDAAIARRNWVIDRMVEDGHIVTAEADIAKAKPLNFIQAQTKKTVKADFFAEEVRRELKEKYGQDSLYKGGLAVRSSVDPTLQDIAIKTLRDGLMAYDKRHGWRGPIATLKSMDDWAVKLSSIATPEGKLDEWQMAVVLSTSSGNADIAFWDKERATLNLEGVRWARKCLQDCYALGSPITSVSQVLNVGDVILVEKENNNWVLKQIPKVQGALVAIDPHTGRVLAMQGGWTQNASSFNRVTQAQRQPGSAFKPFVYLAALDNGYTPSTLVLDAPFVMEQAPGDFWRPTNYSNKFYGPSTLRLGIEKSRNLMTVRLANKLGMDTVVDYATRFGIADEMKNFLSYSLGAGETTLLRLTAAYGMLVNGGKKIDPTFIDRIQNRHGETVYSADERPCPNCGDLIRWDGQKAPTISDTRTQIADEKTAYQIVSMLEGVVERGTARRLKELGRPLAGKTGTTNKSKDAWFIGFSPNLVAGVFVGFDDPKSMGKRETGSSVAAPIWGDFMKQALEETPPMPFRVPAGIKNVRVDSKTGQLTNAIGDDVIWEAFVAGTEPDSDDFASSLDVIDDGKVNPYGDDPYGYNDLTGNNPLENAEEEENPFSYFSSRRRTTGDGSAPATSERVILPNPQRPTYEEQPRTAPVSRPVQQDQNFTGTGGLY